MNERRPFTWTQPDQQTLLGLGNAAFCLGEALAAQRVEFDDMPAAVRCVAASSYEAAGLEFVQQCHELGGIGVNRRAQGLLGCCATAQFEEDLKMTRLQARRLERLGEKPARLTPQDGEGHADGCLGIRFFGGLGHYPAIIAHELKSLTE